MVTRIRLVLMCRRVLVPANMIAVFLMVLIAVRRRKAMFPSFPWSVVVMLVLTNG